MKDVYKYIAVFFILLVIFFSYSVLVSLLPNQKIKKNIVKSIPAMIRADGENYPYAIIHKQEFKLDNFTDAILLSQNYAIDNKKPIASVMNAKFASMPIPGRMVEALKYQVEHENVYMESYPRYWHGNSFLLRPLLLFADYTFIRWLLYTVSSILLLVLGIKLHATLGIRKTIAFMLGLFSVNIFVTQFSIHFFTVVILSVIACILMCKHFKNKRKILLISFIIGCLTSYFDLLTAPLLTCGLPLIVYLSVKNEDGFKKGFWTLCSFVVLWGIGYAAIWSSKWTLATILTDNNVFTDAFNTISYRTSSEQISRIMAIKQNYSLLPVVTVNILLLSLLTLAVLFFNKTRIKTNLLLLVVAIFPYLWFFVLAQHSWLHWWFTYRIQAISIIALFFILINFISWDKISILFHKLIHKKNI